MQAETADALRRAAFGLVELTEDCWQGPRGVGSRSMTFPDYVEQVGPTSSITLQFGELSDIEPWISIDTTCPGEYGRRDAGNGNVQIYTFDYPPEQKARSALSAAANFSSAIAHMKQRVEPTFLTDDEENVIKHAGATMEPIALDGESVSFCAFGAFGLAAASANFADRTVTVWGRFEPATIRLQTVADLGRYIP
jgi:hypothetical protein